MIDLSYLEQDFPPQIRHQKLQILREYLQCIILEILFESPIGPRLTFLGGTCLRLVYGSQRFSEDLDFDNDGLNDTEFATIKTLMEQKLSALGYQIEVVLRGQAAYRCEIKFPRMLYAQGLSQIKEHKLVIQIDTQAQHFTFERSHYLLQRFGVITEIPVTPMDIIFAQKCHAILERPRNKGRDFFDVVYLLSRNVKPNYAYLEQKQNISNAASLKDRILNHWATLDPKSQISDVEGFLFNNQDEKKIRLFGQLFEQAKL